MLRASRNMVLPSLKFRFHIALTPSVNNGPPEKTGQKKLAQKLAQNWALTERV